MRNEARKKLKPKGTKRIQKEHGSVRRRFAQLAPAVFKDFTKSLKLQRCSFCANLTEPFTQLFNCSVNALDPFNPCKTSDVQGAAWQINLNPLQNCVFGFIFVDWFDCEILWTKLAFSGYTANQQTTPDAKKLRRFVCPERNSINITWLKVFPVNNFVQVFFKFLFGTYIVCSVLLDCSS